LARESIALAETCKIPELSLDTPDGPSYVSHAQGKGNDPI
jgi:hypothetical protein